MALFEVADGRLRKLEASSFLDERVRERQELQQWLLDSPSALGENLLIISEEFGDWEDSRRRIDLLALDEDGNLVVVELKRTEDGGHMDLQAIRYAAMISAMSFEDVVRAHADFLSRRGLDGDARARIEQFLASSEEASPSISKTPRIVLAATDFSREITTTVLWLNSQGLDIRCVRVVPYRLDGKFFLDLEQILPLREASEYQVKLREKDASVRRNSSNKQRERTLPILGRHGLVQEGTEIEVVPGALPQDGVKRDPKIFKATIGDLSSRESIRWAMDGQYYSASRLSHMLRDSHGLTWLANNIFVHWRRVGDTQSMWDRAESLTRGERYSNAGDEE